jgi:iron(III) transport system substrate-binding protein
MKKILAAWLGALALLVTSGTASAKSWEELVSAAEKEGRLVVMGPPVKAHRDTIMQFEKAFPKIKVEYTGATPDQFEARISAERAAGKFLWDTLLSGMSSTVYLRQIPAGWFDPLRPAIIRPDVLDDKNWLGGFATGFLDAEAKYVYGFSAELSGNMSINTEQVDPKTFSYESLLDPKWRGKIATLDPRGRGPGLNSFRQVVVALGPEKAVRFLKEQQLVLSDSPKQVTDWAVRGAYPIVIGVNTADFRIYQKQGIGTKATLYKDPNGFFLTKWGNVVLMNRGPNPNAAALFANWLLTKEAQLHWAKESINNSRRTDVPLASTDVIVDEKIWAKGYNLSSAKTAKDGVEALKLATETLK